MRYNYAMKRILGTLLGLIIVLTIQFPAHAQWSSWGNCSNKQAVYKGVVTFQGLECLVQRVLNIAITFIGLGVLVMIVIGAYQLLMSGGDPKGVAAGRQTITYAVLGLILAISSWFIINLIAYVTGANEIKEFNTTPVEQRSSVPFSINS